MYGIAMNDHVPVVVAVQYSPAPVPLRVPTVTQMTPFHAMSCPVKDADTLDAAVHVVPSVL